MKTKCITNPRIVRMDEFPLSLGCGYYISAEVATERRAIDYQYSPRRQQGRDLIADVPTTIIAATLRVWDESGNRIIGRSALHLAELALPDFAEALREDGEANIEAGEWQ